MPNLRRGTAIFCDDIRQEVGGKLSLMGVYHGEMIIGAPAPLALPKLGVAICIISDVDDPIKRARVSLVSPADAEIFAIDVPIENIRKYEGATQSTFHAYIPMSNVLLERDGFVAVWVETEREKISCGRMQVKFANTSEAAMAASAAAPA